MERAECLLAFARGESTEAALAGAVMVDRALQALEVLPALVSALTKRG